jgi:hypothetical protein
VVDRDDRAVSFGEVFANYLQAYPFTAPNESPRTR